MSRRRHVGQELRDRFLIIRPMVIEHSLKPSVRLSVYPVHCGKMADRIWMLFEMVGRIDPGMKQ